MIEFVNSIAFGATAVLIVIGIIGTIVPLLPGVFLIWFSVLLYSVITGFSDVTVASFVVITLITLVTGTSEYWMSLLGAKTGGASKRSLLYGIAGAIVGTFLLPVLGTVLGYAGGLLFAEYQKHGDWDTAVRASVGGLAGWGIATAVQFIGGLIMAAIFFWQTLA